MSNEVLLPLVITDAGRAALVNSRNTGTNEVVISEIALGSGLWNPTPDATELKSEIKRIDSFGGESISPDTIHVTIQDYTTDTYTLSEFGLYTDTGVLFAIYAQNTRILEKDEDGIVLLAADIVLESPDAESVVFTGGGFSLPPATLTIRGLIELATQEEADAGKDTERAIVPAILKGWWDKVRTWGNIKDKPVTATRWPSFSEVTEKPPTYTPSSHGHNKSEISDLGSAAGYDAGANEGQVALIGSPASSGRTAVVVATGSNANGMYRIWSDGYKEQWGRTLGSSGTGTIVYFPVAFSNLNSIHVNLGALDNTGNGFELIAIHDKGIVGQEMTTTSFHCYGTNGAHTGQWKAAGY